MNPCRLCILLLAGCAVGLAVRSDRAANGSRAARAFEAALRERGSERAYGPEDVRSALAAAGPGGLALAVTLLGSPDPAARAGAAAFLGARRSRAAVPPLIRMLRDTDPQVRRAAAAALGAIGDPRALPFLERAIAEGETLLVEAALSAARDIQQPRTPRQPRDW